MIDKKLQDLIQTVIEEAKRSPEFTKHLKAAIKSMEGSGKRRRKDATLDPILLVREGENVLRSKLESLTLDQLKDIVAQYGMDPDKLAMKWKNNERIIDRIIQYSVQRSKKGEAFL
ncbi:MAG: hypothetical protein OXD01_01630 [Gammaproteobacteria bacterium]|nr:hypothetical protein [Gammaproteobacteria bacterium]